MCFFNQSYITFIGRRQLNAKPNCFIASTIEKVPRGIQGEKSRRDMASSRNLVEATY